jgi:hypothetical protein
LQGAGDPVEHTTVGVEDGGTTTVVDLGGSVLLKLRQPASASGSNNGRRCDMRIFVIL